MVTNSFANQFANNFTNYLGNKDIHKIHLCNTELLIRPVFNLSKIDLHLT